MFGIWIWSRDYYDYLSHGKRIARRRIGIGKKYEWKKSTNLFQAIVVQALMAALASRAGLPMGIISNVLRQWCESTLKMTSMPTFIHHQITKHIIVSSYFWEGGINPLNTTKSRRVALVFIILNWLMSKQAWCDFFHAPLSVGGMSTKCLCVFLPKNYDLSSRWYDSSWELLSTIVTCCNSGQIILEY